MTTPEIQWEWVDGPRHHRVTPWEVVRGVTCVVCPDCAFTFSAEHTDDTPDGGYSCPNCENITAPEHLKCQTCGGFQTIQADIEGVSMCLRCPECQTPENVECQTCGGQQTWTDSDDGDWFACPDCTSENGFTSNEMVVDAPCPDCNGTGRIPENMETPNG